MFGMDKVTPINASFQRDAEVRPTRARMAVSTLVAQEQAARGVMFEADPSLRGIKVCREPCGCNDGRV